MPSPGSPITVRDLWSLALPKGTRLLAGQGGLGRAVEWVASLRAAYPVLQGLEPGCLVLARLALARELDSRLTADYLVAELGRAEAAALAVDEPPGTDTLTRAEALRLPLFLLPRDVDSYQVERELLRALLDAQGHVARREAEAREAFQALLSQEGLDAVLAELAEGLKGGVRLVAVNGEVVSEALGPTNTSETLSESFAVQMGGRPMGELLVGYGEAGRDPLYGVLARAAAEVCALELLQRATRRQVEDELGIDLVAQLLEDDTAAATRARLERQGYVLGPRRDHVALAVDASVGATGASQALSDVSWVARRDGSTTLELAYDDHLLLLVSHSAPLDSWLVRRWLSEASERGSDANGVGVSRIARRSAGLGQAIRQALGAHSLGTRVHGRAGPHHYDELGLYRLLADLRDRAELQCFYQETLGDLLVYDQSHGTELVHTLQVLFDQNTNISQTARALYVHRNTLNYRLQRIAEISNLDLNDAETRLALQLALRIHILMA